MTENTCVHHYGGELLRWPASPVLALAVSVFFLLLRLFLVMQMSRKADSARVTQPYYGIINGHHFVSLTGVFIGLNLPVFCIFVLFRDLQGVSPQLRENARQFACYLQDGPNLVVGDYFTILFMLLVLVIMANRRRLLQARVDMARVLYEGGYLTPTALPRPHDASKATGNDAAEAADTSALAPASTPAPSRPFRIAFAQSGAGAWIPPFVAYFARAVADATSAPSSAATSAATSAPPRIDIVCFDSYGDPHCDYRDDHWLRLNLTLEGLVDAAGVNECFDFGSATEPASNGSIAAGSRGERGPTDAETGSSDSPAPTAALTLKVVRTDFFHLDAPSESIDVFALPIGAHTHAVANRRGSKKDKRAFLEGILREVSRTLRPGGCLVSSSAKALGSHQEQWEEACRAVGLVSVAQPEPVVPQWVGWLPYRLRLLFLPNALGVGCGRAGWMASPIYWNVFASYIHVARKPTDAAAAPDDASGASSEDRHCDGAPTSSSPAVPLAVDAIPTAEAADAFSQSTKRLHPGPSHSSSSSSSSPSSSTSTPGTHSHRPSHANQTHPYRDGFVDGAGDDIPTAGPIQTGHAPASLAEREERDLFPPGLQFRLAEALAVLNVMQWLSLIYLVWIYFDALQVLPSLPFNKQVCSFMVSLVVTVAPVIYINAEELREEGKTKGLIVPLPVLRNKILRRWGLHRLNFFLLLTGLVVLWLPYFALDALLVEAAGKDTEEVVDINVYIDIAVAAFFTLGGHRAAKWYVEVMRRSQERFDGEEDRDLSREGAFVHSSERHAKPENEVVLSPVFGRSGSGTGSGRGQLRGSSTASASGSPTIEV